MKSVSAIEHILAEDGDKRLPTWAEDGTDLTLIREMLLKTPGERLTLLQQGARSLLRIIDGIEQSRLLGNSRNSDRT